MSLHIYNKNLLEFAYLLSKYNRLMNPLEISKYISSVKNKQISDRTIRRWLKFLYPNLGYYPYIKYSSLGLQSVAVIIKDLRNEEIIKVLPHLFYVFNGHNIFNLDNTFLLFYLVPNKKLNDFTAFWEKALKNNIIKNYEIIEWNNINDFYSPFHKIMDEYGNINISRNIDNSYFTEIMKNKITSKLNSEIHKDIIKNPLIIPIVFEYTRELWASNKVWTAIKKNLGDEAWDYIKDIKRRKKRTDGVGIKFVYKTMQELQRNFDQFFQQIRIIYMPFYSPRNVVVYTVFKLKNKDNLVEFAENVSNNSLNTIVYFSSETEDNKILFFIVTSHDGWMKIVQEILPKYIDKNYDNKILFMNHNKTNKYWSRWRELFKSHYVELFDPKKCEWKFELNKYLKKLDELNKIK